MCNLGGQIGGGGLPTVTQSNQAQTGTYTPYAQSQFQDIYNRANAVSQTPYQPYNGQLVAGLSPTQQAGVNNINNAYGIQQPYFNYGFSNLGAGTDLVNQGANTAQGALPYLNQGAQTIQGALPFINQGASYTQSALPYVNNAMSGASDAQSFLPAAQRYIGAGASQIQGAGSPITSDQIDQYRNPYQRDVTNATIANINETDAEQQQQLLGNTAAQYALGGDRVGVAQGILARQQGLANNATLANINQQGYNTALQTAENQQQALLQSGQGLVGAGVQNAGLGTTQAGINQTIGGLAGLQSTIGQNFANYGNMYSNIGQNLAGLSGLQSNIGQGIGGLGVELGSLGNQYANLGQGAQNSALQGAQAQLGAGGLEQQTQQAGLTAAYQQYLQALAYPYQQTQFLAGIGIPSLGAQGGTQTQAGTGTQTNTPPGMTWGQLGLGAAQIGAGLYSGYNSALSWPSYGGTPGYYGGSPDTNQSLVPTSATGGRVPGYASGGDVEGDMPWDVKVDDITNGSIPGTQVTKIDTPQSAIKPFSPLNLSSPATNNTNSTASPTNSAATGIGSAIGSFAAKALPFLFAKDGGAIHGYDTGGAVDDDDDTSEPPTNFNDRWPGASMPAWPSSAPPQAQPGSGQQTSFRPGSVLDRMFGTHGEDSAPTLAKGDKLGPSAGQVIADDFGDMVQPPAASRPIPSWVNQGLAMQFPTSPQESPTPTSPQGPHKGAGNPYAVGAGRPDPGVMTAAQIMDPNNFKQFAPEKASLGSLLADPKTRGAALMEMGLGTLAAKPTSRYGIAEAAGAALGTMKDFDQFSEKAKTAQQKGQELAAKLKAEADRYSKMTPDKAASIGLQREHYGLERERNDRDLKKMEAAARFQEERLQLQRDRQTQGPRSLAPRPMSAAEIAGIANKIRTNTSNLGKTEPEIKAMIADAVTEAQQLADRANGAPSPAAAPDPSRPSALPPDPSGLVKGQSYKVGDKIMVWSGSGFIAS